MPNLQKRKPLSHLVWLQALEAEYPEEFLICRTSKKEVRNQIHGKCIYQFNQKDDEPCFSIELELEEGACEFSISRKEVPEAAATGISRESKTASAENKGRRRARNATWAGRRGTSRGSRVDVRIYIWHVILAALASSLYMHA